ncbi:MAG: hypothetical protein GXP41_05820 [Chloroflexi bacterium]|nr:hypothetical protein [Chloroflexota bacterium]
MSDEFDARPYLDAVQRNWKAIAGFTLFVTLVAVVAVLALPARYEATAGVAITKTISDISLVPEFRTISEDQINPGRWTDAGARRQALAILTTSTTVAQMVLKDANLPEATANLRAGDLLRRIHAETQGDFVLITAEGSDPAQAALLANVWARAYTQHVNEVYGARPLSPESVATQAQMTKAQYEKAQQALEEFLGNNDLAILRREIGWRQAVLDDTYRTVTDTLQQVGTLLVEARALQRQIAALSSLPSVPLGNQLALLIFQANAFAGSAPSGTQFQIAIDPATLASSSPEAQRQEIAALVRVLEEEQQTLQNRLQSYSDALLGQEPAGEGDGTPIEPKIRRYAQEVRELQKRQAAEESTLRELTSARDASWKMAQTMRQKADELRATAPFTDTTVRFASPAIEPQYPVWPRKKPTVALAGVLSLLISILAVLVAQYTSLHVRQ